MYKEMNNTRNKPFMGSWVNVSDSKSDMFSDDLLSEILFITTYPPRECGIATYSQDLIVALNNKFCKSFKVSVCAIESDTERFTYSDTVKYTLNTDDAQQFNDIITAINNDTSIRIVLVQHEFGLFRNNEHHFLELLQGIKKPVIVAFHTILPGPDEQLKDKVVQIAAATQCIIVMTNSSADILANDYGISLDRIAVIPHGTHLVPHEDKLQLKQKYQLEGRKVLATFGLLSCGKSIETTLAALPTIVKNNPSVLFLIIGKTHPSIIKNEGEIYREMLIEKVNDLGLNDHVRFINQFLPLPHLLEYLQLTDIYLFTSKDPHQAVSGTFSYAISLRMPYYFYPHSARFRSAQ